MKHIISLFILLSITTITMAQCFQRNFDNGVNAFNKKEYYEAKRHFEAAKKCSDVPQNNRLSKYLKETNYQIKKEEGINAVRAASEIIERCYSDTCTNRNIMMAKMSIEKALKNDAVKNEDSTLLVAYNLYCLIGEYAPSFDTLWYQKAYSYIDKYGDLIKEDVWGRCNELINLLLEEGGVLCDKRLFNRAESYLDFALEISRQKNVTLEVFPGYGLFWIAVGRNRLEKYESEWIQNTIKCAEKLRTGFGCGSPAYAEKIAERLYEWVGDELFKRGNEYYKSRQMEQANYNFSQAAMYYDIRGGVSKADSADKMAQKCLEEIKTSQSSPQTKTPTPAIAKKENVKYGNSDVDKNIPNINVSNDNTYVCIIANENYDNRHVPYAINDGQVFAEYCNKTLGITQNHIRFYKDATNGNIMSCIGYIKRASEANDGNINVIFYYAGHAFPDERTKEAYLLPIDGDNQMIETCFSLKRLYDELGKIKSHQVICFLDACFSGATREDNMLLTGRGIAIKPKEDTPQGNLIVFTSASGNETAHQYEEKQHGLFTYFLLKKMQESNGSFTLGEMYDYVSKNVKKTSFDVNNKIQTPSVIPSETMTQKWRNIKL